MKEYHMDSFAMNVLDIGVCYLGFTWEELGLSKPSDVEIDCTSLLDDMLDGGIFGQNDMNRIHSANICLLYTSEKDLQRSQRKHRLLQWIYL